MQGPYKPGTIGSPVAPSHGDWETNRLIRGQRYRVIKRFSDADADEHDIGEEWAFISTLFSKFDDELTICVRDVTGEEWTIPLIWTPDKQQDIIERWQDYFSRVI